MHDARERRSLRASRSRAPRPRAVRHAPARRAPADAAPRRASRARHPRRVVRAAAPRGERSPRLGDSVGVARFEQSKGRLRCTGPGRPERAMRSARAMSSASAARLARRPRRLGDRRRHVRLRASPGTRPCPARQRRVAGEQHERRFRGERGIERADARWRGPGRRSPARCPARRSAGPTRRPCAPRRLRGARARSEPGVERGIVDRHDVVAGKREKMAHAGAASACARRRRRASWRRRRSPYRHLQRAERRCCPSRSYSIPERGAGSRRSHRSPGTRARTRPARRASRSASPAMRGDRPAARASALRHTPSIATSTFTTATPRPDQARPSSSSIPARPAGVACTNRGFPAAPSAT